MTQNDQQTSIVLEIGSDDYDCIAPGHESHLDGLDPIVIEDVAYSPLKVSYLMGHDESRKVWCPECGWQSELRDLPEEHGRVKPNDCPECVKNGEKSRVKLWK